MIACAYCSLDAIGYDNEGEPTCGGDDCEPATEPLPRVIEASCDDDADAEVMP